MELETSNLVERLIVANLCQHVDDKPYLKGAWSGHMNRLNFGGHEPGMAEVIWPIEGHPLPMPLNDLEGHVYCSVRNVSNSHSS